MLIEQLKVATPNVVTWVALGVHVRADAVPVPALIDSVTVAGVVTTSVVAFSTDTDTLNALFTLALVGGCVEKTSLDAAVVVAGVASTVNVGVTPVATPIPPAALNLKVIALVVVKMPVLCTEQVNVPTPVAAGDRKNVEGVVAAVHTSCATGVPNSMSTISTVAVSVVTTWLEASSSAAETVNDVVASVVLGGALRNTTFVAVGTVTVVGAAVTVNDADVAGASAENVVAGFACRVKVPVVVTQQLKVATPVAACDVWNVEVVPVHVSVERVPLARSRKATPVVVPMGPVNTAPVASSSATETENGAVATALDGALRKARCVGAAAVDVAGASGAALTVSDGSVTATDTVVNVAVA